MESKFYFFPGQTPSNTKISDRAHALHINTTSWNQITKHLDRKRLIQEAIDKEKAFKKGLKDGSDAMTKQWPNSIENLRIKKDQEREAEIERQKLEKVERFHRLKQEHETERKRFIDMKKKEIFISSGYAKQLTSALLTSEMLYEREKQLEFNATLQNHEHDVQEAYAEKVRKDAEADKAEKAEEKRKTLEKNKEFGRVLKQQVEENEALLKSYQKKSALKEAIDRKEAEREQELILKIEHEEKIRNRKQILKDQRAQIEEERQRQLIQKQEDQELEQAVELYAKVKRRIDCMMKSKEKSLREEEIRKKEEVVAKVAAIQQEKDAEENIRIAAAIAEIEEKEAAKKEQKDAMKAKAIQDRIDDRKNYLERLEKEEKLENELKKWEMLNRVKTKETITEHNSKMAADSWANKLNYRRELKEQMAEEAEFQRKEKEIDDVMSKVCFEEADRMFFEYAKEVGELAESRNRSTFPIDRVVDSYKREYGMVEKDKHARCCRCRE